ncbi:MAG: aminotransferase class III-fold pyridoxal phosphate-dependent enzyme [Rhodospirillales bacterium]|nr:aminotransferase class III-fold pyridoxal phosphate-dependent enzyme [Rhodospirillales bacterium]
MPQDAASNSRIVAAWRAHTPGSAELAQQAAGLLPSGITHDARRQDPYGPYIARAQGGHKWDVDGNRYVDFYGGHGALILGHAHPEVTAAIAAAAAEGTQFGANHPREVQWAAVIRRLVPSCERLRFTSSGTEATLMAVRLARAFTGRPKLLRFVGHFHGWHDHMTTGFASHFDGTPTAGVLPGVAENVVLALPGDIAAVERLLAAGDVAAAILEPTGASFGQVPLRAEFLQALRRATERAGTLLIMDEVVTGFRVAPGGAQGAFGVRPDLSTFAKIVAGGMPGAAVGGRKDVLDQLDFDAAPAARREKIGHQGTYNANPVAAAAGIACLGVVAQGEATARADATAAELRAALNEVLAQEGMPWAVYGTSSGFHLFVNPARREVTPARFDPYACPMEELKNPPPRLISRLRLALLLHGVDVNGRLSGFTSAAHGPADVAGAAQALRASIRMLREEGEA